MNDIPRPGDSLRIESLDSSSIIPFDNIYILEEEINSGSFGVVYKAHHSTYNTEEALAVKVQDKSDEDGENNIIHEILLLRNLRDVANVIKLIDFYMDEERIYIVQELAKGGDVLDRLVKRETYTEHDVRELVRTLLKTIQTLHSRNIVHRDLKPDNLLLKDEFDDTQILLCDFGYAAFLPSIDEDGLSSFVGSSPYMAPEIVVGKKYREEVDMWSVGCIIYMLLSGNSPFGDEDDSCLFDRILQSDYEFDDECWGNISANAKSLISNLLIVDQKERWTASKALQSNWFTKSSTSILREVNLRPSLVRMESIRSIRKIGSIRLSKNLYLGCGEGDDESSSESNDVTFTVPSALFKPACASNISLSGVSTNTTDKVATKSPEYAIDAEMEKIRKPPEKKAKKTSVTTSKTEEKSKKQSKKKKKKKKKRKKIVDKILTSNKEELLTRKIEMEINPGEKIDGDKAKKLLIRKSWLESLADKEASDSNKAISNSTKKQKSEKLRRQKKVTQKTKETLDAFLKVNIVNNESRNGNKTTSTSDSSVKRTMTQNKIKKSKRKKNRNRPEVKSTATVSSMKSNVDMVSKYKKLKSEVAGTKKNAKKKKDEQYSPLSQTSKEEITKTAKYCQ